MQCDKCGCDNKIGANFCKKCGQKLEAAAVPNRCSKGHILDPSWTDCRICNSSPRGQSSRPGDQNKTTVKSVRFDGATNPAPPNVPTSKGGPSSTSPKTVITGADAKKTGVSSDQILIGFLVSFSRKPQGEFFELRSNLRYRIGRGPDADIHFPQDVLMSDSHALIRFNRDKFEFQDNMTTNGSFINGEKTDQRTALSNYDELKLGNTEFRLVIIHPPEKKLKEKE